MLLTELKADLNAYLATTPPTVKTRTLADVIAFNKANPRELSLFGQSLFEAAEKTKGLADPEYLVARATTLKVASAALATMLAEARAVALVAPSAPPAWPIDAVNADQAPGGGVGNLAAIAGTPQLTVPMGAVRGLPVGLSFFGPAWSEAKLLGLGYGFEQAAQARVEPGFVTSVEATPAVAALLARPPE